MKTKSGYQDPRHFMKTGKRSRFRLTAFLLAAVLSAGSAAPVCAANTNIEAAKKKQESLKQEKARVQDTLKGLEGLKSDTAAYVKQLDQSLTAWNRELETLAAQITDKEYEIDRTGKELESARALEAEQYASMKLRIKYMYERGNSGILDLLLSSGSIARMMNRAEYVRSISEYDKEKMDEYVAVKNRIAEDEARLKADREELVNLQEQTEAKRKSAETLLNEKNRELTKYQNSISQAEQQISDYNDDLKKQEQLIKELEEEIRRKEEERRRAEEAAQKDGKSFGITGSGTMTWPCPSSSRITSSFGSRTSPTEGATTNHKGIDIGATSGSAIVAADAGEVVIAAYSVSAGNYIMLSHGNGLYTVYMHCSSLHVTEGESVEKGQTIAGVGSTGYSTGPHLHFGVRKDGQYVNPMGYVNSSR